MTPLELRSLRRALQTARRLARILTREADDSRDADGTIHPSLGGRAADARRIARTLERLTRRSR